MGNENSGGIRSIQRDLKSTIVNRRHSTPGRRYVSSSGSSASSPTKSRTINQGQVIIVNNDALQAGGYEGIEEGDSRRGFTLGNEDQEVEQTPSNVASTAAAAAERAKFALRARKIPTISFDSADQIELLFATPPPLPLDVESSLSKPPSARTTPRKIKKLPKQQSEIARSYSPNPKSAPNSRRYSEAAVTFPSNHLLKPTSRARSGSTLSPSPCGSTSQLSVSPGSDSGFGRSSSLSITRLMEQQEPNSGIVKRKSFERKGGGGASNRNSDLGTTVIGACPSGLNIIRTVWTQLMATKGPQFLGMAIFQRTFVKNPAIQSLFRNSPYDTEVYTNPDAFQKAHAAKVGMAIDKVIMESNSKEELEAELRKIGATHATIFGSEFRVDFFSTFGEALLDCTLEWGDKSKRTEDSRKAWIAILSFMTDHTKSGFQREKRNRSRAGMYGQQQSPSA